MHTHYLCFLSMLLICCSVKGQDVGLGMTHSVGAGLVNLSGHIPKNERSLALAAAGGVGVHIGISRRISIETGVYFEHKGMTHLSRREDPLGSAFTVISRNAGRINYGTLPVMCRWSKKIGKRKFFFQAGPYASYLLGGNYFYTARENWDMGLMTGVGIVLPCDEHNRLIFELRHSEGLYNISGNPHYPVRTRGTYLVFGVHMGKI
ncbi:MAG: porin family protein [Bacteroidota bacterium]